MISLSWTNLTYFEAMLVELCWGAKWKPKLVPSLIKNVAQCWDYCLENYWGKFIYVPKQFPKQGHAQTLLSVCSSLSREGPKNALDVCQRPLCCNVFFCTADASLITLLAILSVCYCTLWPLLVPRKLSSPLSVCDGSCGPCWGVWAPSAP